MAEKLFQVDVILKCGRECIFLLQEGLCLELLEAVHKDLNGRYRVTDQDGVMIVIDLENVAICFAREFVPRDEAHLKGMN